jgi:hypothetical protein
MPTLTVRMGNSAHIPFMMALTMSLNRDAPVFRPSNESLKKAHYNRDSLNTSEAHVDELSTVRTDTLAESTAVPPGPLGATHPS